MNIANLTPGLAEPCLALAAEVFAAGSTLHRALGVDAAAYRDSLRPGFLHKVAQGLSAVCLDARGRPAGCLLACDFTDQGPAADDPLLAPMAALLGRLEAAYRTARAPVPGAALLVDMAAVRPDCAGRGIYTGLRAHVQDRARARGFRFVVGELSSAATQALVAGKLGHRVVARVPYAGFEFEGRYPFAAITDPPEIWLTEGRL